MASKNMLSIEPNLSLLKLVKFYGIIKKDKLFFFQYTVNLTDFQISRLY
jgi:hypothetical protein